MIKLIDDFKLRLSKSKRYRENTKYTGIAGAVERGMDVIFDTQADCLETFLPRVTQAYFNFCDQLTEEGRR